MADYLDVLVLCSDPVNFRRTLNLAQELVHFEQVIRRSELPIRLRRVFPPTLDQLQREFALATALGRQPSVFHFLGHGDDDGLYFENEHGEAHLVKGHELKEALAHSPVKVALLNACWSATKRGVSLIEFLTREQVADAAIGHETPVEDVSAIEFARQFYSLITQGKTIREACLRARNSLAEQGKLGAAEVKLVGNGEQVLTAGLPIGSRPCVIESGLPKFGNLPEPPVFYGRGEELVQLSQSFADARLTGFGLWGIGGIGKTALAKVAARRNAWRYEGVVWVDIRDAVHKTTAELLRMALSRLHPGASDADPAFELARRLQDAPSLIVLDNLEDLPEAEHAALARFLQQVPKNGSHVILTARVPLSAIEQLSNVHSRRMTDGLDTWNGARYVQHVARQKQCLALRDELREEAGAPVGLCVLVTERLHGHPKMLELAVGVALQGRPALEQAIISLPDDLERQLALLLAISFECLGDDGRRVLLLLGFFPTGSVTPEALDVAGRAVEHDSNVLSAATHQGTLESYQASDPNELEPEDAEADLLWLMRGRKQLEATGLLDYDQTHDIYTFHQAILDEVYRRRPSDELLLAVTTALLVHFSEYVRVNHADSARLDRCSKMALVLMESVWFGRDGDSPVDTVLAEMTDYLGNYFHERGLWRLGEQWHGRAIELRRSSRHAMNDAGLAIQLFHQGQMLATHAQWHAAREALNEALRLFENAGMRQSIGATLHELAVIELNCGNPKDAQRLLRASLTISESLSDQRALAATLQVLANLETTLGNYSEACGLLQRSYAIFESLGDRRQLAATMNESARIESAQANLSEARRLLRGSLEIFESLRDPRGLAATLHELAILDSKEENPSDARRLLQRSIKIKELLGDQEGLAASWHVLARIEFDAGNLADARQLWERSIRITEETGNVAGVTATQCMLAQLEATDGRFDRAIELASNAVRQLEKLGYAQADDARLILSEITQAAALELPRKQGRDEPPPSKRKESHADH